MCTALGFWLMNGSLCSLADRVVVRREPLDGLLESVLEGSELKVGIESHQLLVRRSLLVLTIGFSGVEFESLLVIHSCDNRFRNILDRDLLLLGNYYRE